MAVSERDFEMLEGYLDDALEMGEVELLRARLASDAEFAAALEDVRGERAARRMFFAALEPDDATAAKLTARFKSSINRQNRFAHVLRTGRYLTAAAACLAIGFFARGWFVHSPSDPVKGVLVDGHQGTLKVEKIEIYQVTLRDESGKVVGVQKFNSIEKAREFAADLDRWQSSSARLASSQFVLHQDRF
jgi:hypothetical protein